MNLNERAAKCIDWIPELDGDAFDPSQDYNHARMLYQRVVEKGLEDKLIWESATPEVQTWLPQYAYKQALRLTAEQLTEACVTVLEAHDESH